MDPRYDPPRLDRTVLDALETGESVEVDAWELPGDRADIIRTFGGLYSRVVLVGDDLVTVVQPVAGPLEPPGAADS